jgi:hypothetical protein
MTRFAGTHANLYGQIEAIDGREHSMKKKLRPGSSMADVKKGLEALSSFWKAGYRPDDLERHYLITWFADSDGRILGAVRKMGIHRFTFQNYMEKMGLSCQTIRLRKVWQGLDDGKGKKSFNRRVLALYRKMKFKPNVTPAQNDALIRLWLSGFPNKIMMLAFILWAVRSGKDRRWISKKMDFTVRHTIRVLSIIASTKTETAFWLSPLKPKVLELYKPRYQTMLKKMGFV